jgi:hypothetical protein
MSKPHLDVPNFAFALRVAEWPFSRFHRYVAQGILPGDWSRGRKRIIRTLRRIRRVYTALCTFAHLRLLKLLTVVEMILCEPDPPCSREFFAYLLYSTILNWR